MHTVPVNALRPTPSTTAPVVFPLPEEGAGPEILAACLAVLEPKIDAATALAADDLAHVLGMRVTAGWVHGWLTFGLADGRATAANVYAVDTERVTREEVRFIAQHDVETLAALWSAQALVNVQLDGHENAESFLSQLL